MTSVSLGREELFKVFWSPLSAFYLAKFLPLAIGRQWRSTPGAPKGSNSILPTFEFPKA
jgi:hypothetical protein